MVVSGVAHLGDDDLVCVVFCFPLCAVSSSTTDKEHAYPGSWDTGAATLQQQQAQSAPTTSPLLRAARPPVPAPVFNLSVCALLLSPRNRDPLLTCLCACWGVCMCLRQLQKFNPFTVPTAKVHATPTSTHRRWSDLVSVDESVIAATSGAPCTRAFAVGLGRSARGAREASSPDNVDWGQ